MHSMTGYGQSTLMRDGREVTVELKSVNHRFLDINVRMPRSLMFSEDALRREIARHLARGHIEVNVQYKNQRQDAKLVTVDRYLLEQYTGVFADLEDAGLDSTLNVSALMRLPEVLTLASAPDDNEAVEALLTEAAALCCGQIQAMRAREGGYLTADMLTKLGAVEKALAEIEAKSAGLPAEYMKKLQARIQELLQQAAEEARIVQEAALYADRVSVDEEIVRLKTHLSAFRAQLEEDGPCGRRLDFLVQEMNRETNTIGSKIMDSGIQALVIDIKCEIEKLREQAQNVE